MAIEQGADGVIVSLIDIIIRVAASTLDGNGRVDRGERAFYHALRAMMPSATLMPLERDAEVRPAKPRSIADGRREHFTTARLHSPLRLQAHDIGAAIFWATPINIVARPAHDCDATLPLASRLRDASISLAAKFSSIDFAARDDRYDADHAAFHVGAGGQRRLTMARQHMFRFGPITIFTALARLPQHAHDRAAFRCSGRPARRRRGSDASQRRRARLLASAHFTESAEVTRQREFRLIVLTAC